MIIEKHDYDADGAYVEAVVWVQNEPEAIR